jgi:hypothetical protein
MLLQLRVAPGTPDLAAGWQWTGAGVAMLASAALYVVVAAYVWRRRGGSAGAPSRWCWSPCCCGPPPTPASSAAPRWRPSSAGRPQVLAVEPALVLGLLAKRATHDLSRW